MKTWKLTLGMLLSGILLGIGVAAIDALFHGDQKKRQPAASGAPVCLLVGDLKNVHMGPARPTGFENLGNMVRLHFEASTLDECLQAIASYCSVRLLDGYAPGNMTMTYRADPAGRVSQKYRLDGHCGLKKTDEERP